MRAPLLYLLLLCLLPVCRQQAADTAAPPTPPATTAATAAKVAAEPTIAQRFSPIISGYWVSADYLKAVARTRSPLAAFDHTPPGPSSLEIRPFVGQKDSAEIEASYGLHEGGNMLLLLHGTKAHSLPIRLTYGGEANTTTELAYQLTATDTTLFYIARKAKTQQIISKLAYRRTGRPGKTPDLETGVAWGVNDLLITGSYSGLDSLHQPVHAQFLTNGFVKGLPFSKYYIQIDFTGPNPGDAILFDMYTKKQQQLATFFSQDTLKLYTIHSAIGVPAGETDTTQIFTHGRLRYQLVRIKKP